MYILPVVLDIAAVAALYETLSDILKHENDGEVILDGAQTERVTTPAIQVLLSFDRALLKAERKMRLQGASETLQKTIVELGFSEDINRWMAV